MTERSTYIVKWEVEIVAVSGSDAAREALDLLYDAISKAAVSAPVDSDLKFTVTKKEDPSE